jgi:hypothetical protein
MLKVANISVTKEASSVLAQMKSNVRLGSGEHFALAYMSRFENADGTPVAGFVPGYVADPNPLRKPSAIWALAQLPNGLDFCFIPKFRWDARQHYLVDIASQSGATLSIGPGRR